MLHTMVADRRDRPTDETAEIPITGEAPPAPPDREVAHTLLVASSEQKTLEFLTKVANHTGAVVVAARDGVEALRIAEETILDLAVLDVGLEVVDGIDLCEKIRAIERPQPLILVTGVTEGTLRRVYQSDADDFLVRPYLASVAFRHMDALLERRLVDAELNLLRRAFDAAGNGLTILDARSAEYPAVYVNRAFAAMTGYAKHEILGRNLRMLQGPETDVTRMARLREAMLRGKAARVVLKNYRKDGTSFWNELAMAPIRDPAGRLTHWVGIQTDATDGVRAGELATAHEEAEQLVEKRTAELIDALNSLEKRRRFGEMILNALSLAVITTDGEQQVSFANEHALEMLRLGLADTLGRPILDVFGGDPQLSKTIADISGPERIEFDLTTAGRPPLHLMMQLMPPPVEFSSEFGLVAMFWKHEKPAAEDTYLPDEEIGP